MPDRRAPRACIEDPPDVFEIDALTAALMETRDRFGRCKVLAFGSRARRDHRPDSDLDVLVLLPDGTRFPKASFDEAIEAAQRAAGPEIALHLQFVPEARLDELAFELPWLGPALRDAVEVEAMLDCAFDRAGVAP